MECNITCIDACSIAPLLALNTNKTDHNDARGIAEAVRVESKSIREVYQKSRESINLAVLLTTRRMLVTQRTALGNTVRGLLKTFGFRLEALKPSNIFQKDYCNNHNEHIPNLAKNNDSNWIVPLRRAHVK